MFVSGGGRLGVEGRYDLVVVGLGSGGLVACDFAARLGLRVAGVEAASPGGDCLWSGCVPSKSLLAAAKLAHQMRHAGRFGLTASDPDVDLGSVWERIAQLQEEFAGTSDDPKRLEAIGVEILLGSPGRLVAPGTVQVGARLLRGRRILLCTGSRPRVPPIPGLEETGYLTSENFFARPAPPRRLTFIGGGPICLELSQAMRRLGCEVTVLEREGQLLVREDPELGRSLADVLAEEGVRIDLGVQVDRVEMCGGFKVVHGSQGGVHRRWEADEIFVGVGRVPRISGLGLEEVGVRVGESGILVDAGLRTNLPGIYACGDVTGRFLFTHAAAYEAAQAVRGMFFPGSGRAPTLVPWCTFTDPELAHVGMTEAEARAKGQGVRVWGADLEPSDRSRTDRVAIPKVRLVTARGKLVGAHILGPNAGDVIHELALAISRRVTIGDLASLVHAYPTYSGSVGQVAAQAGLDRARRLRWLARR